MRSQSGAGMIHHFLRPEPTPMKIAAYLIEKIGSTVSGYFHPSLWLSESHGLLVPWSPQSCRRIALPSRRRRLWVCPKKWSWERKRWHSESAPSRFFPRPIVGVAWSSKGLSPAQRSVAPRSRPRSNPSRFERAFPWRRKSVLAFHRNLPQSKTGTRRPRLWNMRAAAESVKMRNPKSRALRFWDPIRSLS